MASFARVSQATALPSRAPLCRRNLFSAPNVPSHTLRRNIIATHAASTNGAADDAQLKGLLARFDSDGDGRLTVEEAQQAFAAMSVSVAAQSMFGAG